MEGREEVHGLDREHYSTDIQNRGEKLQWQMIQRNIITMHML